MAPARNPRHRICNRCRARNSMGGRCDRGKPCCNCKKARAKCIYDSTPRPVYKRQRRGYPCLTCHDKKRGPCDGRRPCNMCTEHGNLCVFRSVADLNEARNQQGKSLIARCKECVKHKAHCSGQRNCSRCLLFKRSCIFPSSHGDTDDEDTDADGEYDATGFPDVGHFCRVCLESFDDEPHLIRHALSHKFSCVFEMCRRPPLTSQELLLQHIREVKFCVVHSVEFANQSS
jgi:hypothetical protein